MSRTDYHKSNHTDQELKYKFFGLYLGFPFQAKWPAGFRKWDELKGLDDGRKSGHDNFEAWSESGFMDLEYCQLILKPLYGIKDEDAIEVANIIAKSSINTMGLSLAVNGKISFEQWHNSEPEWKVKTYVYDPATGNTNKEHFWKTEIVLTDDTWVSFFHEDMTICFHWHGDAMPIDNASQVIDLLRLKGYSLPYMGLNPVEKGWVKLAEGKIKTKS